MSGRVASDAQTITQRLREAEAIADDSLIALAHLRQAMLTARRNSEAEVLGDKPALVRVNATETTPLPAHTSETTLDLARPEAEPIKG